MGMEGAIGSGRFSYENNHTDPLSQDAGLFFLSDFDLKEWWNKERG